MADLSVVRLRLSGPSAHFRMVQSSDPRRTYPLPPYSTVIGILANVLGDKNIINTMLSKPFGLGILCQFSYVTNEYTWMRNLYTEAHFKRFATLENRKWQGTPEHPGGQSPVTVQVLNEVEVWIYLGHPLPEIKNKLLENLKKPEGWLSHIHLGRSEDWAEPCALDDLELKIGSGPPDYSKAKKYYQWMPESKNYEQLTQGAGRNDSLEDYKKVYEKMSGSVSLVTTVYKLINSSKNGNQAVMIRNFDHIPAKIFNSQVPWISSKSYPRFWFDPDLKTPVYLAYINP